MRTKHLQSKALKCSHAYQADWLESYRVLTAAGCQIPRAWEKGITIEHADLRGIKLHGAWLRNMNFEYCDLRGADLSGADLTDATIFASNLTGANMEAARLHNTYLRYSLLEKVTFTSACLLRCDARGASFRQSNFHQARVRYCDLGHCNLDYTDFRFADLDGSDGLFVDAYICGVRVVATKTDFSMMSYHYPYVVWDGRNADICDNLGLSLEEGRIMRQFAAICRQSLIASEAKRALTRDAAYDEMFGRAQNIGTPIT